MHKTDLNQARNHIEEALRHINKLEYPVLWRRFNDLSEEVDNQIDDDANQPAE